MKSLQRLAHIMLKDLGMMCGTDTARDWKTVSRRIKHEGDEFLTITLPSFGKDFERSLDQGRVADDLFSSFRKRGGLPVFLQGFLQQVFDPKSGTLLVEPSVESIYAVRQFTLAFGKIFELPTPRRERDAMRKFIQIEEELKTHDKEFVPVLLDRRRAEGLSELRDRAKSSVLSQSGNPSRAARRHLLGASERPTVPNLRHRLGGPHKARPDGGRLPVLLANFDAAAVSLFGDFLRRCETDLRSGLPPQGVIPQHGPGATADRRRGNQKYLVDEWPERLEAHSPALSWLVPSDRHYAYLDSVKFLTPEQERPVRVISVPKTAKTPRIIAIEPTAMQYVQQGFARSWVKSMEASPLCSPLIGFERQEPNQLMAQRGSRDGTLATLDLSEASDRVSNLHVMQLFRHWPRVSEAIQACRSTKADVLGHGVIPLSKYASMGSGLTFPVEAMLFLCIVVASIASDRGVPITDKLLRKLAGRVRVYGDDIIVPREYAESVSADLQTFGLLVNRNKSYWTGLFRESCGGDFYAGEPVRPVRLRRRIPTRRKDAEEIASLVSFRNQCYEAGLWTTAAWCDTVIGKFLPQFPIVEPTSAILGRYSAAFSYEAEYACADTHVPLVRGWVQVGRPPENILDDIPALMKWFLVREVAPQGEPLAKDHLQRSGRATSSTLKRGWHRPY